MKRKLLTTLVIHHIMYLSIARNEGMRKIRILALYHKCWEGTTRFAKDCPKAARLRISFIYIDDLACSCDLGCRYEYLCFSCSNYNLVMMHTKPSGVGFLHEPRNEPNGVSKTSSCSSAQRQAEQPCEIKAFIPQLRACYQ